MRENANYPPGAPELPQRTNEYPQRINSPNITSTIKELESTFCYTFKRNKDERN